jgi:zinc protease
MLTVFMRYCVAFAALLLIATPVHAQRDSSAPLPADPKVVRGVLPNGLHYLIRRNAEPKKRAELRLVVNAGSILETDAQRGVAHVVEHMAFNGTRRFPKNDLVNFLERIGMRFGADLNAYTSFDETVYMLKVPTDTLALLQSGLDILEDWAHDITFDSTELRKERGVVIEEWRSGRNAVARVQDKQFPVVLHGSMYGERLPIGTRENLEHFPDSLARQFYRSWYRPDLMTVVAVGDFDVPTVEAAIRTRFSKIPRATQPQPRTYAKVPNHDEPLVSIETDKEYPNASVSLLWLTPADTMRTVADLRRKLAEQLYDQMVSGRLAEQSERANAPFAGAGAGHTSYVRTESAYELVAAVKGNDFVPAAQALLMESQRIAQFGFTATELARARANYLRALEQAYAERLKTSSEAYAGLYVGAVLSSSPIMGIEQYQPLVKRLLPTITLAELDTLGRTTLTDRNRVVLIAAPQRPDVTVPTAGDILAVFKSAQKATLSAYVDSVSDAPLVSRPPIPGRIVSERTLPGTGILQWRLSNGAKVLLKPTTFKADEVLFEAQSPGGASIAPDSSAAMAELSGFVVASTGVGAFNQMALEKKLTGKSVNVGAYISEESTMLDGRASARDLETLFQLAWLRMTQPRTDSSELAAVRSQVRSSMANSRNTPEAVLSDTILLTMVQHHPRVHIFTPELLDSVDARRALAFYRDRFADASGFTFFVVGSFRPDSIRPLVERYLASLPSLNRHEHVIDHGIRTPPGVVERTVHRGAEPKAETQLRFTGACTYSYENRVVLGALRDLLDIRLREVVREDKSGTYGVKVETTCDSIPYPKYEVDITFGSAPDRAEELTAAVFAVIESLKAGAISDSNLVKIKEMSIRAHEVALRQNGSWIEAMRDADEDGRDQRDFLRTPELIGRLTREQLRDAARFYLNRDRYAHFTLLPADKVAGPIAAPAAP